MDWIIMYMYLNNRNIKWLQLSSACVWRGWILLFLLNDASNILTTWSEFEGGLNLLHKAADDAVIWLESTATAVLAK